MKVKEIIEKLNEFPEDLECLLAIDQSAGFENYDHIEVYPIEQIFEADAIKSNNPPIRGYWQDNKNNEKVFLYVFP